MTKKRGISFEKSYVRKAIIIGVSVPRLLENVPVFSRIGGTTEASLPSIFPCRRQVTALEAISFRETHQLDRNYRFKDMWMAMKVTARGCRYARVGTYENYSVHTIKRLLFKLVARISNDSNALRLERLD